MSEQPADESVEVPSDTGADAPDPSKSDDSSGSGDSGGSSNSGSSDPGSGDSDSGEPGGVSDAELPEDLQATEDNPLARHPKQTGDEDDQIGADSETGNAADPSAAMTYGEDSDDDSTDGDKGDGQKDDSADEDS
jgi:hypothetical protein